MGNRIRVAAALLALVAPAVLGGGPAQAATVSFTDGANDAWRAPGPLAPPSVQPPNAALSDPKADIVSAGFANGAITKKRVTYTATMTITGTPDAAYSYVVAGDFGDDCVLYHAIRPGFTARANAFCNVALDSTYVGTIWGDPVSVSGATITGTFRYDPAKLPAALAADRSLSPLWAYTCVSGLEGSGCRPQEVLDTASGGLTSEFTI